MRITLQPAFILHSRPYRETSVLVDILTHEHGRLTAVARGVRTSKSRLKSLLQPFVPLLVSYQGSGELAMLTGAEPNGVSVQIRGDCLLGGLYINELLMRVLPKFDPQPLLYTNYQNTLLELQRDYLEQKVLRLFEKNLLEELGYGIPLKYDAKTQAEFVAEEHYRFHPEHGFELCNAKDKTEVSVFSGKSLLAIAADMLEEENCLRDCKRLMRLAMAPLLGERPLQSRKLYLLARKTDTSEVNTE
jgi:DNA repair protein RecO (recombination protein O)